MHTVFELCLHWYDQVPAPAHTLVHNLLSMCPLGRLVTSPGAFLDAGVLAHTLAHTLAHNFFSMYIGTTMYEPRRIPWRIPQCTICYLCIHWAALVHAGGGAYPGAHPGTPRHDQVKAPAHTLAHTLVHDLLSMLTLGRPGTSLGAYLNSASRKPWRISRCRIGRTLTFEVPEVRGGFWRIPPGAYPQRPLFVSHGHMTIYIYIPAQIFHIF